MSMNEDHGSAEKQAERMRERATQASAPVRRSERDFGGEMGQEDPVQRLLDTGRRLLAKPGSRMIAGLALVTGSTAVLVAREARAHRGARSLRRLARAAAAAFRDPKPATGSGGIAVFTGLAALALAGVTWKRIDAIERSRSQAI
jgi:hypothetical protein